MEYVNRRGAVYYVFQGVTKTGKPKFYVSLKPESAAGQLIDSLPDDFEIYEAPEDARVSVRKKQASDIRDFELQFVQDRLRAIARNVEAKVVIQGRSLTIYESGYKGTPKPESFNFGLPNYAMRQTQVVSQLSPAFRFKLINKHQRIFEAQRFCFRGTIDGWISLHFQGPLDELCQKFLKHLGKESFYELM